MPVAEDGWRASGEEMTAPVAPGGENLAPTLAAEASDRACSQRVKYVGLLSAGETRCRTVQGRRARVGMKLTQPGSQTEPECVERQQLQVRRAHKFLGRQLETTFRLDHASRNGATREEPRADESRRSLVRLWPLYVKVPGVAVRASVTKPLATTR